MQKVYFSNAFSKTHVKTIRLRCDDDDDDHRHPWERERGGERPRAWRNGEKQNNVWGLSKLGITGRSMFSR
jgi:hypothetical protein